MTPGPVEVDPRVLRAMTSPIIGQFEPEFLKLMDETMAMRYEKKPTIITTNIPLSKWADTFSDAILASAILDRLVHHSTIIKITGKSYRLKGKLDLNDRASKQPNQLETS